MRHLQCRMPIVGSVIRIGKSVITKRFRLKAGKTNRLGFIDEINQ